MAQLELSLSTKVQKDTERSEILVRLFQGSNLNLRGKSGIFVTSNHFEYFVDELKSRKLGYTVYRKSGDVVVRNRIESDDKRYHTDAKNRIDSLKRFILESYDNADKRDVCGDWLSSLIDKFHNPEKYIAKKDLKQSFFDVFELYLEKYKRSDVREKNFRVLIRALKRYEMFIRVSDPNFALNIDTLNKDIIEDFESFLRNEHSLFNEYPHIFKAFPSDTDTRRNLRQPQPRGNNTIVALFNKLRAFFNWCLQQDITTNRPFSGYNGQREEKYGTPYYLTLEERNIIADFDLSDRPTLEAQRDIFIFQCCIGCRVSDLLKMKLENIISGELQYIPSKTKDESLNVVCVPLNNRAKLLIEKYRHHNNQGLLFPFISAQKYNDAIKQIFTVCGIIRQVTIINPTSGAEERRPLNEIASSHMARRTFVGNLYKQVKDPNLICPMSGHKYGSKAFARYHEVDREMRNELVDLLD